jgi:large subunit ribosomal protein L28
MARMCMLTGKKTSVGNNVSHSHRKTKRKFKVNLINKKLFDLKTGSFVKLKVSTKALRTLTKNLAK